MPRGGNFADAYSSSNLSTAMNASVGICTVPKLRIFFLPPAKAMPFAGTLHSHARAGESALRQGFALGETRCTGKRRPP